MYTSFCTLDSVQIERCFKTLTNANVRLYVLARSIHNLLIYKYKVNNVSYLHFRVKYYPMSSIHIMYILKIKIFYMMYELHTQSISHNVFEH